MIWVLVLSKNKSANAENVSYDNTSTSSIITGDNVQEAIDQLFTSVSNGKSEIASAITDKGVSTSADASFATMAENIGKISTGSNVAIGSARGYSATTITINWNLNFTPKFFIIGIMMNSTSGMRHYPSYIFLAKLQENHIVEGNVLFSNSQLGYQGCQISEMTSNTLYLRSGGLTYWDSSPYYWVAWD